MQSKKYFHLLCTAAFSSWCISVAGVTNLQASSPARSSEHSPSPVMRMLASSSPCALQGLWIWVCEVLSYPNLTLKSGSSLVVGFWVGFFFLWILFWIWWFGFFLFGLVGLFVCVCFGFVFFFSSLRILVTRWHSKGIVKKMTLPAMAERRAVLGLVRGCQRGRGLANEQWKEKRTEGALSILKTRSVLIRQHFHMSHNR